MAFTIGQVVPMAGCVTRLLDLLGREPNELEDIIGYHRGRLAQGYYIAVLKEPLRAGEFEYAGYTHLSGGKIGAPDPLKRPGVDAARPGVHQTLTNTVGAGGVNALQQRTAAATPPLGTERLAKVLPKIMHDSAMDSDPSKPVQYPVGSGIKQFILTTKKNFLIAAEVDPGGALKGRNFASRIAKNVPYDERVKVRRYLESVI